MVKKIKAMSPEEFLSEVSEHTNKKVASLASRKRLPYTDKSWKPKPLNAVTGISSYDLNRQIQEIAAADKGVGQAIYISGADAEMVGMTLKKGSTATPVFAIGGDARLDVQLAFFLDEFDQKSVSAAFSKIRAENDDPITQAKIQSIAQSLSQNIVGFESGEQSFMKEKEARKNIRENTSPKSEGFKKAAEFVNERTKNSDEKNVLNYMECYYANQEAGKTYIVSKKDASDFSQSCKRLSDRNAFMNTAFNAMIAGLQLSTKDFGLENPDRMKLPSKAYVNPAVSPEKENTKEQVKIRERNISKNIEMGPQSRSR